MRLPRRVPWASLSELEQLCSWIYAEEAAPDSRLRAIHRVRHLPCRSTVFSQFTIVVGLASHHISSTRTRLNTFAPGRPRTR